MKSIYAILLIIIAFNSCRKKCYDASNIDCENYDPCFGKKSINTFFKVSPGNRGFPPPPDWCDLVPTDTFNSSSVLFEIPEGNPENSTYEWKVGSEAETRTGKKFEVDFSQYLNAGKWETHIPVTLTIRTPMNNCLQNREDTVKVVTRELFFTNKAIQIMNPGENQVSYRGYFTNHPGKEVTLQFINLETGSFRGQKAPKSLIVGMPFIDTLLHARNGCGFESCYNSKHYRAKYFNPEKCEPHLTNYMIGSELVYLDGNNKIKRIFEFHPPSGYVRYEFIGERL